MEVLNLPFLAIVLVTILISMTLHEAAHAFVGYWLGDDTAKAQGRLTLNPLAHIDLFTTILLPLVLVIVGAPPFGAAKPVPFNPYRVRYGEYGAAMVALAGPLTNLLLAILAGGVLRLFGASLDAGVSSMLQAIVAVNSSFFIFNMIPFPPLDGSRLLYAFAPDSARHAMERIEGMGFMAIVLFMLIFYSLLLAPFAHLWQLMVHSLIGL